MRTAWKAAAMLLAAVPVAAQAQQEATLYEKATGLDGKDWSTFLVDTSGASISAFSLLGVPSEQVASVENVRDITVAVKGFGTHAAGFGVSVTPARTSFTPMSLQSYASNAFDRFIGAATLGYARGTSSIGGADYSQQAVSVETNYFFRAADDPVVAVALAVRDCDVGVLGPGLPSGAPSAPLQPAPDTPGARKPAAATPEATKAAYERAKGCKEKALGNVRWNRSAVSLSFATGWIRASAGGGQQSLGRTAAVALTYGFDHSQALRDSAALHLTLRHSDGEPVLDTLAAPTGIVRKDSTLAVLRLTGGSKVLRVLGEASNADSRNVTVTQRAYKHALGVDYRLTEGTWLNFRIGRQRSFDGTTSEITSLLSLSYSPGQKLQ